MDILEFQRRIANAPFTRVTIPPHNRASLPDWIIKKMLEMEKYGFKYAFDVHNFPLQDPPIITTCQPPEVNFKRQRFVQKAIDTWIDTVLEIKGSGNALRGLKIALLLGIDNYLQETGMRDKEVPSSFFVYNGLLNQLLPIFLLEIRPGERRYFWSEFDKELDENNKWRTIFCGALAMARLMYGFGPYADLWLPPIVYDLHLGGDLLIRTENRTFYVQVKGRGGMGENPFRISFLRDGPTMSNPPSEWEKEMNKLWGGAQQFSANTGIPVIPTVAEVNINGTTTMWEIEEFPGLLSCTAQFLDSLK